MPPDIVPRLLGSTGSPLLTLASFSKNLSILLSLVTVDMSLLDPAMFDDATTLGEKTFVLTKSSVKVLAMVVKFSFAALPALNLDN